MKLLELSLAAWGSFRDARLDFSPRPLALHVIYGRNEAGKSTALRGIRAFLFGIPLRSRDAHLVTRDNLRIGARVVGDGAPFTLTRKTGRTTSLLDESGGPVDELELKRLLGGVSEELFASLFGLDHEGLRAGAQALLEGRGDLGESLFAAGLGGAGLHEALGDLRAQAEALFTPQAHQRPLSKALRELSDAQKRSRHEARSGEAYETQRRGIAEAEAERERLEGERRALQSELHRLRRARRVLPLLARRAALGDEARALGEVVLLPERATRDREEAEREAREATGRVERLAAEVELLAAKRGALRVPEGLLADGEPVAKLQELRGSVRKAAADLPRVRGDLARVEEQASALLLRLGRPGVVDENVARTDPAAAARVRRLAPERPVRLERVARASRERAELVERRERLLSRRAALPEAGDGGALRAAVARAQRRGDLEREVLRLEMELARSATVVEAKRAALAPFSVGSGAVPSLEAVARAEAAWLLREERAARLEERAGALARQRAELGPEIESLRREGAVPTEGDLLAARARRDEAWRPLGAALRDGVIADPAPFERSVAGADALADRLRREAERVARLERLLVAAEAAEREAAVVDDQRRALSAEEVEQRGAWRALWSPAAIDPASPSEMRGWLARHGEALASAAEQDGRRAELETLRRAVDDERRALLAALPPDERLAPSSPLGELLERASSVVARSDAAALERRQHEEALQALEREEAARTVEERAAAEALSAWQAEWGSAACALGLGDRTAPEEALAILEALGELAVRLDEAAALRRRAHGMERDAAQFAAEVERLIARHAPELAGVSPDEGAAQLLRHHQRAVADAAERARVDERLAACAGELEEQRGRLAAAEGVLALLRAAASASDLPSLQAAEERSRGARALQAQLREVEQRLLEEGEGQTIASLEVEQRGADADALASELEALEERAEALEQERRQLDQTIGSQKAGLALWDPSANLGEAAAEAQMHLARARELAERYLRLRVASLVLQRQIERYRERHQGPLLRRGSELFERLTLGAWTQLRAGWSERDEPRLLCVRDDGREHDVTALSDGTRDQLYLALRLASLERHASASAPLPLIVDDVLIHFDDPRSRAALEILGELSSRLQVLFFTHHARLVELAREAVPTERLLEHQLP